MPAPEDELRLLRRLDFAGFSAGAVGVLSVLAGGGMAVYLIVRTRLVYVRRYYDSHGEDVDHAFRAEHSTLAIGVAVAVLSLLLAVLAATVSYALRVYVRPRLALATTAARRSDDRLADETW